MLLDTAEQLLLLGEAPYASKFGKKETISVILLTIVWFNPNFSFSMFASGIISLARKRCAIMTSSIIILGPASLGFFSSRSAGKNMMKMKVETPKIDIISVVGFRFGIIHYLFSILS